MYVTAHLFDRIKIVFLYKKKKLFGFHYDASHEGTNTSDTIGSIVKSVLKYGIFKHPEIKIRSDNAVINIIGPEVNEGTKYFDLFLLKTLAVSKELLTKNVMHWKYRNSMVHSLVVWDNQLSIRDLSCDAKIVCKVQRLPFETWILQRRYHQRNRRGV